MTKDSEQQTVRVRPVAGRLVRNEVTQQPITDEVELPLTRALERRIAQGDLERVDVADRDAKPGTTRDDDVQPYVRPEPRIDRDDTQLSPEERRAALEVDRGRLEKEKF